MSQIDGVGVELCNKLTNPDNPLALQQNLNETSALTRSDGGGTDDDLQSNVLNNNERAEGGERNHNARGADKEGDDDDDEVMKEEEEEEALSEESSSLVCCQSPDTPMTDSSYSETGSLLEVPCPLSPEPTSSNIPLSVNNANPSILLESSCCDYSDTGSSPSSSAGSTTTCTTGSTIIMETTDPLVGQTEDITHTNADVGCVLEVTAGIVETTESFTSAAELNPSSKSPHSNGTPNQPEESSLTTAGSERLTSSSALEERILCTTGAALTASEATSSAGLPALICEHTSISTPLPTPLSASDGAMGPSPSSALTSLDRLAEGGDDTHLPQYLHQIAEAFVLQEDYKQALRCLQLERLYHQRILYNLKALEDEWERRCQTTSSDQDAQQLDALRRICQTHNRPASKDTTCMSLDFWRAASEERLATPQPPRAPDDCAAYQVEGVAGRSSHLPNPPVNNQSLSDSPEKLEKKKADRDGELEGRAALHSSHLTDEEGSDSEREEVDGGLERATLLARDGQHPSTSAQMDQSEPAELQGGEIDPTQENKVTGAEGEKEEQEAAVAMDDEGEEDGEKKEGEGETKELPHHLSLEEDTLSTPQEPERNEETEEEDKEEYEYGIERVDFIAEEASLDDLAKLIIVHEVTPAPGLVSILKKRSLHVDNVSVSETSDKRPPKRRVRFQVPADDLEVGSGDSCLLLFLLCLVTVVISIGGTALYCTLGDAHSSVCQDFSRNADFYITQVRRGVAQIQYWFALGS